MDYLDQLRRTLDESTTPQNFPIKRLDSCHLRASFDKGPPALKLLAWVVLFENNVRLIIVEQCLTRNGDPTANFNRTQIRASLLQMGDAQSVCIWANHSCALNCINLGQVHTSCVGMSSIVQEAPAISLAGAAIGLDLERAGKSSAPPEIPQITEQSTCKQSKSKSRGQVMGSTDRLSQAVFVASL